MNTDGVDDKPDIPYDSFRLPELSGLMHLSTDLIVADILGELSSEGHSNVAAHTKACHECAEVHELAKKALLEAPESDEDAIETKPSQPLDAKTKSRVEFFAMLNARRGQLIDMIAKLLFPQAREVVTTGELHFLDRPSVDSEPPSQTKGRGRVDAVQEIADFVMLLQDLIMERCSDAEQMRQELPRCIDDAMGTLDIAKGDEVVRRRVMGMLLHFLCQDNE